MSFVLPKVNFLFQKKYVTSLLALFGSLGVISFLLSQPGLINNYVDEVKGNFHTVKFKSSSKSIESYYTLIYDRQTKILYSGGKPKVVVYRYKDGSGFGNRMRATSYAFLLSLYTGRLFLVDHEDHEIHFNNPGNDINIFWRNFDHLTDLQEVSQQLISVPQAFYDDFCGILPPLDESADIYEHIHGNDPSICFLGNETQKQWAVDVFGTSDVKIIRGEIMNFLLKRPQPNLLLYVSELKKALQWEENVVHVCIQFRAFVDNGFEFMKFFPQFCNQTSIVLDQVLKETYTTPTAVWVTSDFEDIHDMYKNCSGLENVTYVVSPFKVEHTSKMPNGAIKPPIVEWYLIGEADWVLSTGTSFAEFALARTNYVKNFYVWDEPTETLHTYITP